MNIASEIKQDNLTFKGALEVSSWDEIVEEASRSVDYDVELEDLLSQEEFQIAYNDLDKINKEFSGKTKLNKVDIAFLFVATSLQILRWCLMNKLVENIEAQPIVDSKTGDKNVKQKQKDYANKHSDWDSSKENQGKTLREKEGKSWKEIVFGSVPYDATAGSPAQNVKMEGGNHRYKTLGHDPILGWIFGTANILTDTITLNNFTSYRIAKMKFTSEMLSLPTIFSECLSRVQGDIHLLPAAIFKQGVHFTSDRYTKKGLPVPIVGVFSETLSGKLYKDQYNELSLLKDMKTGTSAVISMFINMIVGLIHGFKYKEESDGDRELYEARTRKILMYSNIIASSSNVLAVYITKNPKKLDIGGLLVTASRLFTDIRFITRVKQEFVNSQLDVGIQKEIDEANSLFAERFI